MRKGQMRQWSVMTIRVTESAGPEGNSRSAGSAFPDFEGQCIPERTCGQAGRWALESQVASNLCDAAEGVLVSKCYLIDDQDPLFNAAFLETVQTSGINP